jgi:hypothetical protein
MVGSHADIGREKQSVTMGTDNIQVEAERTVPAVEPSEAAEKTKREASVQEGADAEHHERARSRYLMHQSFASSGIPTEVAAGARFRSHPRKPRR